MSKWKNALLIILGIFLASLLIAVFFENLYSDTIQNKIAVIHLDGEITLEDTGGLLSLSNGASATTLVNEIQKADQDPSVKGIIIEINSPGGTVVASEEIANAVKAVKKPTVAWIREVGASGAYWVASSTDNIVADPLSITGSIGVLGSYIDFAGLMQKYGVNYNQVNGGAYKDIGSPYTNLTSDEKSLLQSKIDKIHEYFINEVARNRNMSVDKVRKLADGSFYLGMEAKDNGLIDELGGKDEAISQIKKLTNQKDVYLQDYSTTSPFGSLFSNMVSYSSFYIGEGIASGINTKLTQNNINIKT